MDRQPVLRLVRRHVPVVVLLTVLGLAVAFLALQVQPRQYAATTTLAVRGTTERHEAPPDDLQLASSPRPQAFARDALQSYADIATTPFVLEPVQHELGLENDPAELARMVSAHAEPDSRLLSITAVGDAPTKAAELANTVAAQLITSTDQLTPRTSDTTGRIELERLALADPRRVSVVPNDGAEYALGGLLGLVAGLALAGRRVRGALPPPAAVS